MKTRHQMLGVLIAAAGMMILSACGSDNDNEGTSGGPTDTPKPTATKTLPPTPIKTNTLVPTGVPTPTNTTGLTPTNTVVPTQTNTGGPTAPPTATPTVTPIGTQKCGNGVTESPEKCDNGGTCTLGDNVGATCTSDAGCGGTVDSCQPTGGDGCAANCTPEGAPVTVVFDPAKTKSTLQTLSFALPLALKGSQASTAGEPGPDGIIPISVKAVDVHFDPVHVTGLVCACVRGKEVPAFGAGNSGKGIIGCGVNGLPNVNMQFTLDHAIGWVDNEPPGFTAQDCTDAGGRVEDGSPAHPHEGLCNGPATITTDGESGPTGSALISTNTAIGTISDGGSCATEKKTKICAGGTNPGTACTTNANACAGGACVPAKGDDGIPCNADDPIETQGTAQTLTTTTGTASGAVLHAGGFNLNGDGISEDEISADFLCGNTEPDHCQVSKTGNPYDCAQLAVGVTTGAANVSTFAALDAAMIGDDVVSSIFTAK